MGANKNARLPAVENTGALVSYRRERFAYVSVIASIRKQNSKIMGAAILLTPSDYLKSGSLFVPLSIALAKIEQFVNKIDEKQLRILRF